MPVVWVHDYSCLLYCSFAACVQSAASLTLSCHTVLCLLLRWNPTVLWRTLQGFGTSMVPMFCSGSRGTTNSTWLDLRIHLVYVCSENVNLNETRPIKILPESWWFVLRCSFILSRNVRWSHTHTPFSPCIIRERKFILYLAMEKMIRAIGDNLLKMLEHLQLTGTIF